MAEVVHKLKRVQWQGRTVPVVCQNLNGPCPLLAICNILILRDQLHLPSGSDTVTQARLLHMAMDLMLERHSRNDEMQQHINDALSLQSKLTSGMDVNLRFHSPDAFEYTAEVGFFELFGVKLLHGWVVDQQDVVTSRAIGQRSYNEVLDMLVAAVNEDIIHQDSLPAMASERLSGFRSLRLSRCAHNPSHPAVPADTPLPKGVALVTRNSYLANYQLVILR